MKFSLKMALAVLLLLTLCLTITGFLMIERNFNDSLSASAEQNAQRHNEGCFIVEKEAARYISEQNAQWIEHRKENPEEHADQTLYGQGGQYAEQALVQAGRTFSEQTAFDAGGCSIWLANGTPVYSVISDIVTLNEQIAATKLQETEYTLCEGGEEKYMLMSTPLAVVGCEASLVSAYSVTSVFDSRDTQLRNLVIFTLCTLGAASLLTAFLSGYLARPLQKLKSSSESIAAGNYSERTDIQTDDEFGAVSRSFDMMAAAVESNIQELKLNVRQREDFVAAFTHEIKTPMSAMLGYSSLLCAGIDDPEQQRTAHEYIWRETRRLEALSQKLLLLLGLKEEALEAEPFVLQELADSLIATLPQSPKEVSISVVGDPSALAVGDPIVVDNLLRNLVLNACNACESGGRVDIGWEQDGDKVKVTVKDNGCGISKEDLQRITEPFYMVDKSRAREINGSGIGLALAAKIAELHGSELHFDSEIGVGTSVSFALPAAKEERDETI